MKKTYKRKVFNRKLLSVRMMVGVITRWIMVLLLGFPLLATAGARDSTRVEAWLVKGKVTDVKGIPLPGVTVRLDSTSVGSATDGEGKFSLTLPREKGVLVFSFVGFESKRVNFAGNKTLNVVLRESVSKLDEVVVVAYGEQNRRDVVGSMSAVRGDDFKDIPSPSLSNLLQGRVAGMSVLNMSGAPGGGGTSTTIRGFNSLSVESSLRYSEPLWVVDGVPMYSFTSPITGLNTLADLDPRDIESVQVLKDAASASIYGSRAANGVILVTTRKGRLNQKAKISFNVSTTWVFHPALPDITGGHRERLLRMEAARNYQTTLYTPETNSYDYMTSYREAYEKGKEYDYFWGMGDGRGLAPWQDSLNPFYNNSTNLFDYYFRTARVTDANLQLSGGSGTMAYTVGVGYYDEKGVLRGTGFKRLKLQSNMYMKPFSKIESNLRFYLTYTDRSRSSREMGWDNFSSGTELETLPGELTTTSTLYPGEGTASFNEAVERYRGTKEKNDSYRARANFDLSYEFIEGLKFRTSVAVDYTQQNQHLFLPANIDDYNETYSSEQSGRGMMLLNENLLSFKRSFGDGEHNVDVLVGHSVQVDESNAASGWGKNAPSDLIHYVNWSDDVYNTEANRNLKDFTSEREKSTLVGLFGRLNYNYKQKYLASITVRRDASSKFGEDTRWGTFPAYAVGYAFSEEPYMDWARGVLDYAKLRMSYGKSGRQFENPYLTYGLLTINPGTYNGHLMIGPELGEGLQNRELTWEESKQYDFGLDVDFFNHRLGIVVDYYYRYTDNLLYLVSLPGNYSGFSGQWRNAYALSNEGIEFQLKWDILRRENLSWNVTFNIASNWNRLEKSYDGMDVRNEYNSPNISVIGKPLNGIFVLNGKGYYNSDGKVPTVYLTNGRKTYLYGEQSQLQHYRAGDRIIVDEDGDGRVSIGYRFEGDGVYGGSPLPKATGGILSNLQWKGFDLNVLFNFVISRHILNAGKGQTVGTALTSDPVKMVSPVFADLDKITFWQKPGDQADFPMNRLETTLHNFDGALLANVENVSFLKLKTLTLGYTLPARWKNTLGIGARVFLSAENVFTVTNYTGPDPESVDVVTGIDNFNNYPLSRKFTLGLTLDF